MAAPRGFIGIQIIGDTKGVDAMLRRLESKLSPTGIALWLDQVVDPWIRQRAEARFRSEGDDVTGPWAPLKPFTQNARYQQGYGAAHPINVRSGELERYVVSAPNRVVSVPGGAVMESPNPSAANGRLRQKLEVAAMGLPYPATVPRPVMGLGATDLEYTLVSLAQFIQR